MEMVTGCSDTRVGCFRFNAVFQREKAVGQNSFGSRSDVLDPRTRSVLARRPIYIELHDPTSYRRTAL